MKRRSLLIGDSEVIGVRMVVHVGGMSVESKGASVSIAT
jgi:hypothetical protein